MTDRDHALLRGPWFEGYEARMAGKSALTCPYLTPTATKQFPWFVGWTDAEIDRWKVPVPRLEPECFR